MTTASEEKQEAGQLPAETAPGTLRRQGRTCASSVTPPDSVALQAVTQGARAVRRLLASGASALDRPGSLGDAQPPAFRQAREWHHRCAGHYGAAVIRWPRLAWGYAHLLLVMPALRLAEWVTASPARLAVALAVVFAAWLGS